jgi:hypothetical protein
MKLLFLRNGKLATTLMALSIVGFLYSCQELEDLIHHPQKHAQEKADVVYDWYQLIVQMQLHASPQPQLHTNLRNFGYIGVGLYEAVSPGIKGSVSLSSKLYQMPAMPEPEEHREYVWGASANAALASMFKQFLVGMSDADMARIDSLENAYNEKFRSRTSDAVFTRSQAFGRAIATAIYDWSTTDNFNISNEGYTIPEFPGAWVPTPPAFANPFGPFIKDARPFLEYSLTATAPPLPFPYSEDPSSEFYKAAKEVYDISNTLTDEEKAIADVWGGLGGSGIAHAGGGHILSIVTGVLMDKKAKLGQAAEVYAKTGIALKDGLITTFRGKFEHNLLRPSTYINEHIDPDWETYLPSPPYPEYPSGLTGLYAPVLQVLIREFGDIPVTDNAYVWRGIAPRHYSSISALEKESGRSRVYAGIHYQFTMDITREIGKKLGDQIANIDLTPYH